ncbi:alpha/beta hydrolase [Phragmitibacter flavus]|uniref:Alpha/beta hydrolase n=2 Tax=Phragmitibacter flavus TaxID=2576071 RepID=A0A5R8KF57_9BACT|nr:alpha/beta hydrolase [Phragmitibacter flavus]
MGWGMMLLMAMVGVQGQAQEKPKWKKVLPDLPESVELFENVEIAKPEGFPLLVNVYVPKAEGAHPGLLLIHGGGWQKRQIDSDMPLAERLAARGYVVVQVRYRLAQDAMYPAAVHDCKTALRYVRANAAKYRLDKERVGVMGGSAGGHLSGLMGMTGGFKEVEGDGGFGEESTQVKACIVMAATMDLMEANKEKNGESHVAFFGPIGEKREVYLQASPIEHVKASSPPTLFIEGEKDTLKIGRAEMQEKLKAAGVATELVTLKGAPHPFWMSQPWLDETAKAAGDWFDRYLK